MIEKLTMAQKPLDIQNKINEVIDECDNKQDNLTFDTTPTQGSMNPVTSGGVYTAIEQTAGLNTELLNDKADTDLSNVSNKGKQIAIGWGLPDYTAGIDIGSYITSRNNYTCPQIGFVTGHLDPNGIGFITVNANNVVRIVEHGYVSFYVEKGDLINVTFSSETTWGGTSLTFFPLKGAI